VARLFWATKAKVREGGTVTDEVFEHELLGFILHVGGDETGKVKCGTAIHQELVVNEAAESKMAV
jgi:hypothetical protein